MLLQLLGNTYNVLVEGLNIPQQGGPSHCFLTEILNGLDLLLLTPMFSSHHLMVFLTIFLITLGSNFDVGVFILMFINQRYNKNFGRPNLFWGKCHIYFFYIWGRLEYTLCGKLTEPFANGPEPLKQQIKGNKKN